MKILQTILAAIFFSLIAAEASAQQPAPARPQPAPPTAAPGQGAVIPDGKIATIDSNAFADPKAGIKRVINAFAQLDREFKPQRDEVQRLNTQYNQLVKDLEAMRAAPVDERAMAAKQDQAETVKREIERKQQDGQVALERRARELTNPIFRDINSALLAYAKQRGVVMIFDLSKMGAALFLVNDAVDLTPGFIAEYNQRNPA